MITMLSNPIASVGIDLPCDIFDDIKVFTDETHVSSVEIINTWLEQKLEDRAWVIGWQALKAQVENDNDLNIGHTPEEIVTQIRQTRRELWEVEYAHLYQ
jgi:hypothetical protein